MGEAAPAPLCSAEQRCETVPATSVGLGHRSPPRGLLSRPASPEAHATSAPPLVILDSLTSGCFYCRLPGGPTHKGHNETHMSELLFSRSASQLTRAGRSMVSAVSIITGFSLC